MSNVRKRIEWIDIAKGISIILVVYGHSGLNMLPVIGPWLCAYRMPFFFFVSGLLFSGAKYDTIIPFLQKRIKTLYRPYFIFSAILMLGIYLLDDPRFSTPEHMLQYVKTGWQGWALWFIPVLSLTEIVFYYITKIKVDGVKIAILISLAIVGRIAYLYELPNPYNVWFVLTSIMFYGLGSLSKTIIIKFSKLSTLIIIGASTLFCALSFIYLMSPGLPEFSVNNMASIWIYPAALCGALFMCTFAMVFERFTNKIVQAVKSFVIYMGKNSYVVLAFHEILLKLLGKTGIFSNGVLQRLTMWIILVYLIYIIVNYFPAIIGRTKTVKAETK